MNITYLGNKELLGVPKTAFLAASNIPPDMVLKCYDWAVRMTDEGRCVISGFSSHLENESSSASSEVTVRIDFVKEFHSSLVN